MDYLLLVPEVSTIFSSTHYMKMVKTSGTHSIDEQGSFWRGERFS